MKVLRGYILISLLAITSLTVFQACEDLDLNLGLTEQEVIEGLTEALLVGTDTSVARASALDGYFENPLIKILLPEEAEVVEEVISVIPGGQLLIDEVVLKLNRAAEEAAKEATPIFVDAITGITFNDAFDILNGEDTAATAYLRTNTSTSLYDAFKPDIEEALSAVGAQQAWQEVIDLYNSIPLVEPVNADLADFTTDEALDGLFFLVGEEERKIREDPLHRVTDILELVFGS